MKLFILLLSLVSFPASADMFKCKDANGKMAYQDQPCRDEATAIRIKTKSQNQRELDSRGIDYPSVKASIAKEKEKEAGRILAQTSYLQKRCIPGWCEAVEWRRNLSGLGADSVTKLLGKPRVQLVGDTEMHYYNVKSPQGNAKLQLHIKFGEVEQVNIY